MDCNVVWFKKDLRTNDHRCLLEASQSANAVVALYIYEPEWFNSYEFDSSHLQFVNESLQELEQQLSVLNIQLVCRYGSAEIIFTELAKEVNIKTVYAHQETGVDWTYQRDLRVASVLRSKGIKFTEYLQFSVIRKLQNRDLWNAYRKKIIERPLLASPKRLMQKTNLFSVGIMEPKDLHLPLVTKIDLQKGGGKQAHKVLDSFLSFRGETYLQSISSPALAKENGSRLSPYITYGLLSLSEIHNKLKKTQWQKKDQVQWRKSLWAFENRLWWHCHFIQKLESEPAIEFENMNRAFDGLRESQFNPSFFEAWKTGTTGYPMIDASMRCLLSTGWLNFRMRAMLVSFASYQLWLDWKKTSHFLARHFLDFEPGIHFSQFQMQSGVTGINAIRIYSPIKQAQEQVRAAEFIKTFCPELSRVPDEYVHEPHTMPPLLLLESGVRLGEDYPFPVLDHKSAYDLAKKRIFEWRSLPEVRASAKKVIKKHASRKISGIKNPFPEQNREAAFGNFSKTKK